MGDTAERNIIDDPISSSDTDAKLDAKLDPEAQSAIVDLKSLDLDLGSGKDGSS